MTQVCVPISPRTSLECRDKMQKFAPHCDLFEIRSDAFEGTPDLSLIFKQAARPVLWTHRIPAEGGRDNPRQGERLQEYQRALAHGARWIDVEWQSGLAQALSPFAASLVLSLHDFEKTPPDIVQSVVKMAQVACGVVKVATQVNTTEDLHRLLESALWLQAKGKRFVVLGMGEDAKPLRVLAPCLGSEWTYVALDAPTAAGQLTEADLELYRFRALSPDSQIFAVIGDPIAHSLSPRLHNSAYRAMNLDAVYLAIRVNDLDVYLKLADTLGITGWSVTLPWKTEMARRCLLQDSASRRAGVVNTVRREGDSYLGWNTDWAGFLEPLRKRCCLQGLQSCVIGTGGAARTAVAALTLERAQVTVLGRRREALQALADEFPVATGLLEDLPDLSGELVVNATPVGMSPWVDSIPIPASLLKRFKVAYDLVYTPRQTAFLRCAQELGLQTISGWEMFVRQAAEQVKIFTGREPPAEWFQLQAGYRA